MTDTNGVSSSEWDAYKDLVKWTCWRIVRRYGGDYEECYSEALVHFVEAVQDYEPILGSLSNWISYKVYRGLQETKRTRARRLGYTGAWVEADESVPCRGDWFGSFCSLLSSEAQVAAKVLVELDVGFYNKSIWKLEARRKLKKLGYDNELVNKCFSEIEAAIT